MKAAFFDVDGTLTTGRVWEGMMGYFKAHRMREWTNRFFWYYHSPYFMLRRLKLISESTFRKPWAAHLAWYVRGYTKEAARDVWDWVVDEFLVTRWRRDVRDRLDQHREGKELVMLVSGGPGPLLQRIALELGVEHVVGTELEVRDGRFTGRSLEPICLDENKAVSTRSYLEKHGLEVDFQSSYAYADSISDLPLLASVGNPVGVYPDEALRREAQRRGWKVFP